LKFDYAYAKYSNDYPDSLEILITTDCGETWTSLWLKSGDDLATAPDYTADLWVPAADQWKTDSIDLVGFLGEEKVAISFSNIGHYGQGIYLDNINIEGELYQSVDNELVQFSVFPNPSSQYISVILSDNKNRELTISLLNELGQEQAEKNISTIAGTQQTVSLDIEHFPAGIYLIQLNENGMVVGKMKVVKM